jgi:hypothetical protein
MVQIEAEVWVSLYPAQIWLHIHLLRKQLWKCRGSISHMQHGLRNLLAIHRT